MERISRDELFMNIAYLISQRGTCERLRVGCIIVKDHRIISTGYNGPMKDADHCTEYTCDLSTSCDRAIHAEANAIYWAAKHGIKIDGSKIYCTHSPCVKCTEAIIQSGIKAVYYEAAYRDDEPLKNLIKAGVEIHQHDIYLNI